jgi:hypothetical protein
MSQSDENPWEKVEKCPLMKTKVGPPPGPLKFCDSVCPWYDECAEFKREALRLIGE